jgi:hypothetical protein
MNHRQLVTSDALTTVSIVPRSRTSAYVDHVHDPNKMRETTGLGMFSVSVLPIDFPTPETHQRAAAWKYANADSRVQ